MATEAGISSPCSAGTTAPTGSRGSGEAGALCPISTASDAAIAEVGPAPGYALTNPEHAAAFQRRSSARRRVARAEGDRSLRADPAREIPMYVSLGTEGEGSETHLRYRRRDLVLGLGCERAPGARPRP